MRTNTRAVCTRPPFFVGGLGTRLGMSWMQEAMATPLVYQRPGRPSLNCTLPTPLPTRSHSRGYCHNQCLLQGSGVVCGGVDRARSEHPHPFSLLQPLQQSGHGSRPAVPLPHPPERERVGGRFVSPGEQD